MELAIGRTAAEDDATAGDQHASPVRRLVVDVRPHLLARVDIPCLHFAHVIGARPDEWTTATHADKWATRCVLRHGAQVRTAQVVVGGDVDHPRARAESDRRPVLATVHAGTEVRALPRHWLLLWVDVGFTRHRIEAAEDVLIH